MGMIAALRRAFSAPPQRTPLAPDPRHRPIQASYDAASLTGQNVNHWLAADALDADAANSKTVRSRISRRSRSELSNNGQGKGIQLTQANYLIGRGPKLRMETGNDGFNRMVESAWKGWCREVRLAKKLRTMVKAKVSDGEAITILAQNPGMRHPVKLFPRLIECEQCSTPYLGANEPNKIDGIEFDEFGNPTFYDILKQHPGSSWPVLRAEVERILARFVLHLYREDRPGQHRGVGELHPSLNLFAQGRRYREATVAAAENIANFSLFIKTQNSPNTAVDQVTPLTTLPIEKSMMVALPHGWDGFQPKAEQPSATYGEFTRAQSCEQARPLNMPYNIAAADSSGYSFSGGKLDHLTYFVAVDVEQSEIEDDVLEPLFDVWFAEAVHRYGWSVPESPAPSHGWDWARKPVIDEAKTAGARKVDLSTGAQHRRRLLAEDGLDVDDEDAAAAADLGLDVTTYRRRLFDASLATPVETAASDDDDDEPTPPGGARNRLPAAASRNRNGSPAQ